MNRSTLSLVVRRAALVASAALAVVGGAACGGGAGINAGGGGRDGGGGLTASGGQIGTGGGTGAGGVAPISSSGGQSPATGGQSASGGGRASGGSSGGGGASTDGATGDGGIPTDGAAGSGGVSELIHYYGRWNRLADRAITVNSGSHLGAQFTGTAIVALFDISVNLATDMPTLAWQIDNGPWQEGDLAATVSLGAGLAAGTHAVTLMARALDENQNRWSPPLVSSIAFLGFSVTGGAVQMSPRPVRPKMEFLGDSITEGVVVWKSHNGKTTQCWRNDGRIAYPSQTAQMLGAEWRQVGFGYLGILKTGDGGVPKANDSFNWVYQSIPRDSWQADMVVVNEGTNDSPAATATFRAGYATYLSTIRAAYPNARIVAMRPFNGSQAAPIKAEVDARNAAGDSRVYFVDTTGWLIAADFDDGLHPNVQGSLKAAQALAAALTRIGLP